MVKGIHFYLRYFHGIYSSYFITKYHIILFYVKININVKAKLHSPNFYQVGVNRKNKLTSFTLKY